MESLLEQRERDRVLLREKATTPVLPWVKLRLLVSWMWRTSWGLGALLSSPASHKGLGPQSRLQWVWGLCPPHPWGAPHPSPWLPAHIPFPGPFTMGSVTSQRKKKKQHLILYRLGSPTSKCLLGPRKWHKWLKWPEAAIPQLWPIIAKGNVGSVLPKSSEIWKLGFQNKISWFLNDDN